jgi:hypothetical protein
MTQPAYSDVRTALAATITAATGLQCSAQRVQVNPPCGLVLPVTGTFARYQQTLDYQADYLMRLVVFASLANSESGQDIIDAAAATDGTESIPAAVRADPTLGGLAADAAVIEATGYGVMNVDGIDYLAAHFIVEVFV